MTSLTQHITQLFSDPINWVLYAFLLAFGFTCAFGCARGLYTGLKRSAMEMREPGSARKTAIGLGLFIALVITVAPLLPSGWIFGGYLLSLGVSACAGVVAFVTGMSECGAPQAVLIPVPVVANRDRPQS